MKELPVDQATHNKIVSFIWGIADDVLHTEQVPLLEEGGIEAFIRREVLPYTPDAWVNNDATKIGYEVSFTRHFYKPQPLRTLAEISAEVAVSTRTSSCLCDLEARVAHAVLAAHRASNR